jgi:fatty acid desaturase
MDTVDRQPLITQAEYAKKLRPLLPAAAFIPDPSKVIVLFINVLILILGWGIAANLDRWDWHYLPLFLPLALVMGNSITVLIFSSHEMLHSGTIKNSWLRGITSMFGWAMSWMPPTLWKVIHHREHHQKTNSLQDPDRNYLQDQPNSWGKWIQDLFVPSAEVNPIWFAIGMTSAWSVHNFRNIISVLIFNDGAVDIPPAAFKVSHKERQAIAIELFAIISLHLAVCAWLGFNPIKLILGYFLPIWIGHSGAMFYIYTNHLLCRMTSVNDPLINSLSLRVPKIFDLLHLNFSYHTEHHIFPGMNSDYYPLVRELLQIHYPDRFNLLDAGTAWRLMLQTPKHYKDELTFTDWNGEKSVISPLVSVNNLN